MGYITNNIYLQKTLIVQQNKIEKETFLSQSRVKEIQNIPGTHIISCHMSLLISIHFWPYTSICSLHLS